jgi:single-stranded DNA-binding protein
MERINLVIMQGIITSDIRIDRSKKWPTAFFRLKWEKEIRKKDGSVFMKSCSIGISAWNKDMVEAVSNYHKGDLVEVKGELTLSTKIDAAGVKTFNHNISLLETTLMGPAQVEAPSPTRTTMPALQSYAIPKPKISIPQTRTPIKPQASYDDEELPF